MLYQYDLGRSTPAQIFQAFDFQNVEVVLQVAVAPIVADQPHVVPLLDKVRGHLASPRRMARSFTRDTVNDSSHVNLRLA